MRGPRVPPRTPSARDVVERTFRAESGQVLATLTRVLGDLTAAEDAVQEAFAQALRAWPVRGVPSNPGAWITTTARNRAYDRLRRERRREDKERAADDRRNGSTPPVDEEAVDAIDRANGRADRTIRPDRTDRTDQAGHAGAPGAGPDSGELGDWEPVPDDQLRLVFTCCHPALAPEAQVALTLRLVCGLQTSEIARAFLQPEPTVAQRLVRAKRKIRAAAIPFRVPPARLLPERVGPVLACVYLVFSEGYAATSGDALIRHELCEEAIRLAELLVDLLPDQPEAHGLAALLLLQDSRRASRVAPDGTLVLLEDQDRGRWDRDRIDAGVAHLARADEQRRRGPYQLQAAIAAAHALAPTWEATDCRIAGLYSELSQVAPSPVVELNRAVAVAQLAGPEAGLAVLDRLTGDARLARSHLFAATRADLLRRLGRDEEAAEAYRLALTHARTDPQRAFLRRRLTEVTKS